MLPRWFRIFNPLGWVNIYLIFITFIHEIGHLVVGLITGHKITRFRIGSGEPIIKFNIGKILFQFSFDSYDSIGGGVAYVELSSVSKIGRFFTVISGACFEFILATGLIYFAGSLSSYEHYFWLSSFIQYIVIALAILTYCSGFTGLIGDIKNTYIKEDKSTNSLLNSE